MDVFINLGFILTYILLGVAVAALVVFPIYFMVTNFGKAKGGLLGFAVLLAIFAIAIGISPAEQGPAYQQLNITPFGAKVIGGGLLAFYMLFGISILAAVYSEVSKWFR